MKLKIVQTVFRYTLIIISVISLTSPGFAQNNDVITLLPGDEMHYFDEGYREGGNPTEAVATFTEMGKPSGGYPVIMDMIVFNNRLYLTTVNNPLTSFGTNAYYTTNGTSYTKVLEDNSSQGFLRMGVFDNQLWIPDGDPNGLDPSFVYISSSGDFGSFTKTSVISAVHTFDVIKYMNDYYCSNGMNSSQGGLCKFNGSTQWTSAYQNSNAFRMKYMAVFQNKLFVANRANSGSDVDYFMWTGAVGSSSPSLKNVFPGTTATFRFFATSQGKLFWACSVSGQRQVQFSTDGNNWQAVSAFNGTWVHDFAEVNGKLYALATDGLWESSDYATFTLLAAPPASDPNAFMPVSVPGGLNADGVASMEVYNGAIWCGSSTNGKVYKVDIATSVDEDQKSDLASIHPNPMRAFATLQTSKPVKDARMVICNAVGQQVRTIEHLNGNTFRIDRDQLAPGIYYIQLQEGDRMVAIEKLIVTEGSSF